MKNVATTCSRTTLVAAAILVCGSRYALAADPVPPEFRGDWVPATVACDSPVRFRVTETQMTLVNVNDSATYDDIEIALTFFGPDYTGISVVAMPEFNSGEPPFTVFFNADDQKDVTRLDIYAEMNGPPNPTVDAIQARAKKLAERFPLNRMSLKKCAAGAKAS